MLPFIIGLTVLAAAVLFTVWKLSSKRKLSGAAKARIEKAWAHVETLDSPALRVLEADKVLDRALTELGYKGTLGQKLKIAGKRFSDLNGVWSAHRLRNELAHESGMTVDRAKADRAVRAFRKAIGEL